METENQKLRARVEELSRETMLLAHTITDLTAKLKLATSTVKLKPASETTLADFGGNQANYDAWEKCEASTVPQPVDAAQAVPEAGVRKARELLPKLHSLFNRLRNPANISIRSEQDSRAVGDASELCRTLINTYESAHPTDTTKGA